MTEYQPGTVAVATVRGYAEPIRVFRSGSGWQGPDSWLSESRVTDVRPLVVLDLDDPNLVGCSAVTPSPDKVAAALRETNSVAAHAIARQIEAQTKPPRIPEPGLWGVVQDELGEEWVRAGATQATSIEWMNVETCIRLDFDDLPNPVLVRPGTEDAP